jgi:hypothetical protein
MDNWRKVMDNFLTQQKSYVTYPVTPFRNGTKISRDNFVILTMQLAISRVSLAAILKLKLTEQLLM